VIAIVVRDKTGKPERHELDLADISIGAAATNDIVLGGSEVSARHGRLVARDGRLIVVDLKSETGTYVNGRRITSPIVMRPADKIYIGNHTLHVGVVTAWPDDADATPIVDATEIRLLSEIAAGDDLARAVYADWLDERGRPDRAELLRLLQVYDDADDDARGSIWRRMYELVAAIEPRWRLRVSRPVIQGCQESGCPSAWNRLESTDRKHIRTCGTCARSVVFCVTAQDANSESGLGNSVAIDLLFER
jgi:uncharacterized protein (TIGR02996 family)